MKKIGGGQQYTVPVMEVERLDAILTNGDVDITGYSNGADESGNKGSGKNPWG